MTFLEWFEDLERRCKQHVDASTYKEHMVLANVQGYDKMFAALENKCAQCRYPLAETNFHIYEIGDVCNLCHALHKVISASPYFVKIHCDEKPKTVRRQKEDGRWYDDPG